MDYLVAVVTICILTTQPQPKAHCRQEEVHVHHRINLFACEGIMVRKLAHMREELSKSIKPWEMLSMHYECMPINLPGLDQT